MTVEKIICDECSRVKAEANHWHQIGVYNNGVRLELGKLEGSSEAYHPYEIHDLCGEQCFHKHIAKLLGFSPPAAIEEAQ